MAQKVVGLIKLQIPGTPGRSCFRTARRKHHGVHKGI